MTAATLLRDVLDAGLELRLDGDVLKLAGDANAVQAWAPRLRPFKAELIAWLLESSQLTHELLRAVMRCCDHHGDDAAARDQMRDDVLAMPPHLRADLLDHFDRTYPINTNREAR